MDCHQRRHIEAILLTVACSLVGLVIGYESDEPVNGLTIGAFVGWTVSDLYLVATSPPGDVQRRSTQPPNLPTLGGRR